MKPQPITDLAIYRLPSQVSGHLACLTVIHRGVDRNPILRAVSSHLGMYHCDTLRSGPGPDPPGKKPPIYRALFWRYKCMGTIRFANRTLQSVDHDNLAVMEKPVEDEEVMVE